MLDELRAEGSILAAIRDKREITKETDDKLKALPRQLRQDLRLEARSMPSLKDLPAPDPQRPVDAEDHLGHEDGRRRQAAARAGAGRGGPPLCRGAWSACSPRWRPSFRRHAGAPQLLAGTGTDKVHLLIVATSDRGLCGGFNSSIVREARRVIRELLADGKTVKILCIGRKGARPAAPRLSARLIIDSLTDLGRPRLSFDDARRRSPARVMELFDAGEFDVAHDRLQPLQSAMTQIVTRPAADPVRRRRRGRRGAGRPRAARSTSSSPTRRRSWPSCCRATSRSRSSARCSRTRRASRARG